MIMDILAAQDRSARRATGGHRDHEIGERGAFLAQERINARHEVERSTVEVVGDNEDDIGPLRGGDLRALPPDALDHPAQHRQEHEQSNADVWRPSAPESEPHADLLSLPVTRPNQARRAYLSVTGTS